MLKSILLITISAVAGQVCEGRGPPLVGRLGNRLICSGPRSVTCPAGSVCEVATGACCSAVVVTTVVTPIVPVTTVLTPVTVITPVVSKCQVGSPFKNNQGLDIDCSTTACPVGSECIVGPNNVFHACCAVVPTATAGVTTTAVVTAPAITASPTTASPTTASPTTASPNTASPTTASPTTAWPTLASRMIETIAMGPAPALALETVRYLSVRLLNPTEAIAMWAPPNGTSPISYSAELSYDGSQWRALSLEQPTSTFVTFNVAENTKFWVRVTPYAGASVIESWSLPLLGKGKGKASRGM